MNIIEYSPPICVIKLPDICQLKCKYCFREYDKKITPLLYKAEDLVNLLNYYPEIKIISFLGGEPLLFEKEIKEIIELTKDKIKKYIITTNGLNLNKTNIQYFIENHVQLNISLDGNKEVNDLNRGEGVYEKVIKNIDLLREIAPKYYFWTISSTFSKNTINSLYDSYLHIRSITPKAWALNIDKYGNWNEEDYQLIQNELIKIKKHYESNPRTFKWLLSRVYEKNILYNHSDHLIVHPNGEIYQGFPFSKEIISIKNQTEDIKIGNIFSLNFLKPLRQQKYDNLRPCFSKKCDEKCPFKNKEFYSQIKREHGNLLCKIYNALRRE